MVVMLKHCCCGCTLKTGALIIAVVFAILAALQVVMYSVAAVEASERHEHMVGEWEIEEQERLTGTPMPYDYEDDVNGTALHRRRYEHPVPLVTRIKLSNIWKWCLILLSITETISFFLNILLMFAANKDSAPHVLVWLLGFLSTSCSRILLQLVVIGTIFYVNAVVAALVFLGMVTLSALGAAYSLVVVQSYRRQLVGTGIARRISRQDE